MTPLHAIQQNRLTRFGVDQCVDILCHILPGIDDGPRNLDESLTLARLLMRDGITTVIATPHQLGRYDGQNIAAAGRAGVEEFQKVLDEKRIPLRVVAGGEVGIDERIAKFLADDRILTLADARKHLLLELPSSVAMDPAMLMPRLAETGLTIVLAHAERYENLHKDPDLAEAWVDAGVLL